MKTQKELNELKKEYELLSEKLSELSEEELKIVGGGVRITAFPQIDPVPYKPDIKYKEDSEYQTDEKPVDTGDYKTGIVR